jgi:hypothetical protein
MFGHSDTIGTNSMNIGTIRVFKKPSRTGVGSGNGSSTSSYMSGLLAESKLDPEAEAGRAAIDVGAQYDKSLGIQSRNMGRMGINPTSPRYQGLMQDVNMARAASTAGEMGRARREADNENFKRHSGIASMMQNERQIGQNDQRISISMQQLANAESAAREEMRGDRKMNRAYKSELHRLLNAGSRNPTSSGSKSAGAPVGSAGAVGGIAGGGKISGIKQADLRPRNTTILGPGNKAWW